MNRRTYTIISSMVGIANAKAQDIAGKTTDFRAQIGLNVDAVRYITRQNIDIVADQPLNPGSYK